MAKVLCISVRIWKIVFYLLQYAHFGLFIGSTKVDVWFKQRWDHSKNLGTETYKGRLFTTKDHLIGMCDVGDSYKYCHDECRDFCDDLFTNKDDCRDFCDRFSYWYRAGVTYFVFDLIAAVLSFIIAFIISMSCCKSHRFKKIFNFYITGFLMIAVLICHFLGFVVWASITKLKFNECTHNFYYSESESVCAEDGAKLALAILIWLIFIVPLYFFVVRKAKSKKQIRDYREYELNISR